MIQRQAKVQLFWRLLLTYLRNLSLLLYLFFVATAYKAYEALVNTINKTK